MMTREETYRPNGRYNLVDNSKAQQNIQYRFLKTRAFSIYFISIDYGHFLLLPFCLSIKWLKRKITSFSEASPSLRLTLSVCFFLRPEIHSGSRYSFVPIAARWLLHCLLHSLSLSPPLQHIPVSFEPKQIPVLPVILRVV